MRLIEGGYLLFIDTYLGNIFRGWYIEEDIDIAESKADLPLQKNLQKLLQIDHVL